MTAYEAAISEQNANESLKVPIYINWSESIDQFQEFEKANATAYAEFAAANETVPLQKIFIESWNQSYKYTCLSCEADLFLYKYYSKTNNDFTNICVVSCEHTNMQTKTDIETNQCLYMGPFCEIVTTVKDSNTGKDTLSCYYTHLNGKGYILGNRYKVLNYLAKTDYANPSNGVDDLKGIKALE